MILVQLLLNGHIFQCKPFSLGAAHVQVSKRLVQCKVRIPSRTCGFSEIPFVDVAESCRFTEPGFRLSHWESLTAEITLSIYRGALRLF